MAHYWAIINDRMIERLHYITQDLPHITHQQQAKDACKGGVRWLQLRVKNRSVREVEEIAHETLAICSKYGTRMIVNDFTVTAKRAGADGVHLGKEDMDVKEARALVGERMIIGGTANTFEDVLKLAEHRVDYIGLGPFRFTHTKANLSPVLGIEGYKRIMLQMQDHQIRIPVIAIGGITLADIAGMMECGVYGVAVSSAINLSNDRKSSAAQFMAALSNTETFLTNEHGTQHSGKNI